MGGVRTIEICKCATYPVVLVARECVLAGSATPAPVLETGVPHNSPKVDLVSPEGGLLLEPGITVTSLGGLVPFDLKVRRLGPTDCPKAPGGPSTTKRLLVDLPLI